MVTCPRCQQPVDETVRSTCPLCFTPIPQAAHASGPLAGVAPEPPGPPQPPLQPMASPPGLQPPSRPYGGGPPQPFVQDQPGLGYNPAAPGLQPGQPLPGPLPPQPRPINPGTRVSLTGEVIDPGMTAGPAPSYVGGAGAPPPSIGGAARPQSTRTRMTPPVAEAPEKTGGGAVGAIIGVVVGLAIAAGGYFWMMNRTNPKDQAKAIYKAVLLQDYKSAYELIELSPDDQKKYPNVDAFAADAGKVANGLGPVKDALKAAASTITVGEPTINGDKAEVPTSCSLSAFGRDIKVKGTAHMKNDLGIWKLDATADSLTGSGGRNAFRDLIGTPDMSSFAR